LRSLRCCGGKRTRARSWRTRTAAARAAALLTQRQRNRRVLLLRACALASSLTLTPARRRQGGLRAAAAPLLPAPRRAAKPPGFAATAVLLPCLLAVAAAVAHPHAHPHDAAPWRPGPLRSRGGPGPGGIALCGDASRPEWAADLGAALGWLSAACYASSRVSQLARNAARASAEGLSPAMFALAIAGNSLYAASVALRLRGVADAARAAPWLAGSLGVLCLDGVLVAQALRAAAAARAVVAAAGEASEQEGGYAPPAAPGS
jgi:hypothetical protein